MSARMQTSGRARVPRWLLVVLARSHRWDLSEKRYNVRQAVCRQEGKDERPRHRSLAFFAYSHTSQLLKGKVAVEHAAVSNGVA